MPNLEDASLTQLASLASSDRIFIQRPGDTTDYYADVGDLPQPPASAGAAVRRNLDSFVGASATARALDAADSGEPWSIPPGTTTFDQPITGFTNGIDVKGASDGLRMNGGTIVVGPPGGDIFQQTYNNAAQSRPGGQNQVTIGHLGMRLRPNGANTRSSHDRCTTSGYGVGIAALAFVRGGWPSETTGTRTISNSWNTSHSRIHNITCDVENGAGLNHGCALFHSQGNTYGTRWHDLDSAGGQSLTRRGCESLITVANPYVQRATVDAGSNRIVTSNPNKFLNNQRVMIRAHDLTGTRPGGIDFDTEYHVINRTGSNFQISTSQGGSAVSITSSGSGFIYAILVDSAGGEFSPDECYIDRCSHYNTELGISVANPERLWIGNITSYAAGTILEVPGFVSHNRTRGVTVTVMNIYSQSPQAQAGLANSPCCEIDCDGLFIGTFQCRGADTGPQPIFRFKGNDHTILNFDGRSSFGQGGIDARFEAVNTFVTGQCHASSTVTVLPDTVGRLRQASGGGYFFAGNFA